MGCFTFKTDCSQKHSVHCAVSHFVPDHWAVSLGTPENGAIQKLSVIIIMFYFSA